jgi:membrane-bound lytic murein transglycosylase D
MNRHPLRLALVFATVCTVGCASAPAPTTVPNTTGTTTSASPTPRNVLADLPHERVDYWVERFSRGDKRAEIEAAFARKPAVETFITEELRRRGMPEDLIYLAMAESGLNPEAHSVADAVGIWQLVPDTARRFGLTVNETVDERRDLEKSTTAALSYLSYLYNRFGSWYLAAAAYNAGENRVSRIMTEATGAETGTDADYYRVWDLLPGETRDYVPAMVALARMGKTPVGAL